MKEVIEISVSHVRPEVGDVLRLQGIPPGRRPPKEADRLFHAAVDVFLRSCRPRGIVCELSSSEFAEVYRGEGLNEKTTPLDEIFKDADYLALFAVTMGQEVTDKINRLFEKNEFALGSMLDAAASVGSEKLAEILQNCHLSLVSGRGKDTSGKAAMRFSPGYCGWHMSGQRRLFEFLRPEEIGIRLLDSFLMNPLKSISGVIVIGDRGIFAFENSYPFCSECKTRSCLDRMNAVFGKSRPNDKKGVM